MEQFGFEITDVRMVLAAGAKDSLANWSRFRKYLDSLKAEDPAAAFVDPDGYRRSLDETEAAFHKLLAEQQQRQRR